jgi:TetR/AcrR family transcriptional regulator, copper-responsive repressor
MEKDSNARSRGRPPAFDRSQALDAAMRAFWTKGYEGTSMADLSAAMKLNPPSIYGAFGDKKALFEQAICAYEQGPGCFAQKALEEENPRKAIERLLLDAAEQFTNGHHPAGCMIVLSALNCRADDFDVAGRLAERRQASAGLIGEKIAEAWRKGQTPENIPAEVLTTLIVSLFQGFSIRARDGATREELQAVAKVTMASWKD